MLDPDNNFFYPWNDSHHIEFYLDGFLRRTNNSNGDDWFEIYILLFAVKLF